MSGWGQVLNTDPDYVLDISRPPRRPHSQRATFMSQPQIRTVSLTTGQRTTLAGIQATNGPLYRAYLLKEQLRAVFQAADLTAAKRLLIGWLAWAQQCRLPAFVKLAKTIKKFRQLILNVVEHGLFNARSEATTTHLRLLTRRSYGLSPESLMAMADLTRGGLRRTMPAPPRPGSRMITTHRNVRRARLKVTIEVC